MLLVVSLEKWRKDWPGIETKKDKEEYGKHVGGR